MKEYETDVQYDMAVDAMQRVIDYAQKRIKELREQQEEP